MKHPRFATVSVGFSMERASAELAASTRRASPAAHKANPALNRVKGK